MAKPTAHRQSRIPAALSAAPPAGALWAVTMVRNEADIIERTVRHLLGQGVDRVLVMDNGSDDETPQILAELARDPRVLVGRDQERRYFQAAKMTLLSRYAWRHGAKWVIPFDADEFWIAPGASLAQFFASCKADVVRARIFNAYPGEEGLGLDPEAHVLQKVAFRAHPLAELEIGNHKVYRVGSTQDALDIVHVPWRSYEQFSNKLRQGAKAFEGVASVVGTTLGEHWRALNPADEKGYRLAWDDLLSGQAPAELCWVPSPQPRHAISLDESQNWSTTLYQA